METPLEMPEMQFDSSIIRTIPQGVLNEMPKASWFDHNKKQAQVKANVTGERLETNKTFKVNKVSMKIGPTMILNFKKE